MRILCSIMLSFRQACKINKGIKPTQKQQAFRKTCCKLKKHSVYIKLALTLQSLTALKMGELLLTANSPNLNVLKNWRIPSTVNSPKLGFRYNSDS